MCFIVEIKERLKEPKLDSLVKHYSLWKCLSLDMQIVELPMF